MYSRQTQKAIYSILNCYANNFTGQEANATPISDSVEYAKNTMMSMYLKSIQYAPDKDPIQVLLSKYMSMLDTEQFKEFAKDIVKYTQDMFCKKGQFSLQLNLMSQAGASRFYQFLIDKALEEDIPLRNEIIESIDEGKKRQRIFACIIHHKCCICGRDTKTLHHHKSVGFVGGYAHDKGDLPITSLCQIHHAEYHDSGMTKEEWQAKYPNYGYITCTDEEKEKIKKLYPTYFQAYENMKLGLDVK